MDALRILLNRAFVVHIRPQGEAHRRFHLQGHDLPFDRTEQFMEYLLLHIN
jgi:hypothetical protein